MKMPVIVGIAVLALAASGVIGCGGDSASTPAAATAPVASAPAPVAPADVVVPASGAAKSLRVDVGDTFTVWLDVSRRQTREALPAVGWARDDDGATALATQGAAATVAVAKGRLRTSFTFTAATAGSADMGFRQITSGTSGITPLARTAVVHLTVD